MKAPASVNGRYKRWQRCLHGISQWATLSCKETRHGLWALEPISAHDTRRGFGLYDRRSWLYVAERWAYSKFDSDWIIVAWKYQFSQPDQQHYSGNYEWVFRYEWDAYGQGPALHPHLNIHHPDPIKDTIHYPTSEEPMEPEHVVELIATHFPGVRKAP